MCPHADWESMHVQERSKGPGAGGRGRGREEGEEKSLGGRENRLQHRLDFTNQYR